MPTDQYNPYTDSTPSGEPLWMLAGYHSEDEYNQARATNPDETERRIAGARTLAARRISASRSGHGPPESSYAFGDLYSQMPTRDELSVDYGQEGDQLGAWGSSAMGDARADPASIAAQRIALERLGMYAQGGLSAADLAGQQLGRQQVGMQIRGQREADQASLAARGMGGSGAQLASLMGGQQAGAGAYANLDAQMQIAAQQRALAALGQYGELAGQMRGQSFGEESGRRSALDEFNRWRAEQEQAREGRNVERRGRTAESRAAAAQQGFSNATQIAAGQQGNAQLTLQNQQYNQDRTDRQVGAAIGGIGSLAGRLIP